MPPELTERDFLPQAECRFQHWGDRDGEPFCHIRPLSEAAAERLWRRAAVLLDTQRSGIFLDLAECGEWDVDSVKGWLLDRFPDRDEPVFVCYQPRVAVRVPWGVLCDHWLTFFWTAGCVSPADERWSLVHDGDRFAFHGPSGAAAATVPS
jgi:hypothetical protein